METSDHLKRKRTPLITIKSFLVSFVIILGVYIFVSMLLGNGESKQTTDETIVQNGVTYEYTIIQGDDWSDTSILSIPVTGIILTEQTTDVGFFNFLDEGGVTYGYSVKEELKRAADNPDVRAILLEINSPGGTIGGAKAISDGIRNYQEATGNPVYAHITDLGASGGYWAAASTDLIVADFGSAVGSIGVIQGPFRYYDDVVAEGGIFGGVETAGGIEYRYFTAGEYKDTGSPYRRLTEEEEDHWQTALNNEYELFVEHVSTSRDLSPGFIRERIKALPYETTRALELGLIDAVGSKDEALQQLATAAGLEPGTYNVIQEDIFVDFFSELFGAAGSLAPQPQTESGSRACSWCSKPLYLYDSSFMLTTPQ
ncbi:MAG: S49 family peptidase [Patescibacteria group bacterium]